MERLESMMAPNTRSNLQIARLNRDDARRDLVDTGWLDGG